MTDDRRTLIRRYKETPRTMGVGVVRNTANGKALIFASADLPSLLNRHRAQLGLHTHANRELQRDWDALGAQSFEFATLDTLSPSDTPGYDPAADLRALEALWMEKLAPYEPAGYHRRPG